MKRDRDSVLVLAGALCAGLTACEDKAAEPGVLNISVYGEEFIEEGIPTEAFADGWSVTFSKFLIGLHSVSAARPGQAAEVVSQVGRVFDLAKPSEAAGFAVVSGMVQGGRYADVSFRIAPLPLGTLGGNAEATDRAAMTAAGASVWVSGTATKGATTKTFTWAFANDTEYAACAGTAQVDGNTADTQLTFHGDHLFYDDLVAESPLLAFELIAAADVNADGVITAQELATIDIGSQARYGTGSTGIDKLWDFIAWQTTTLGHIDGEGHCNKVTRR